LTKSTAFILGFTVLTFSCVPALLLAEAGLPEWLAIFITAALLIGGSALIIAAFSAGFREDERTTGSLKL
jgi:hypothetical protein